MTCPWQGVHPCILGFLIILLEFLQSSLFCLLSVLFFFHHDIFRICKHLIEFAITCCLDFSVVFRDFSDISPAFYRLLRHLRFFFRYLYKSIRTFDYINTFFYAYNRLNKVPMVITYYIFNSSSHCYVIHVFITSMSLDNYLKFIAGYSSEHRNDI